MPALIAAAILLATLDDMPRAYRQSLARIGAAKSLRIELHTTEMDGSKSTSIFVFQKPNRWRISTGGMLTSLSDGKLSWNRVDGKWTKEAAPSTIPPDLVPIGFDRFADPKAGYHDTRIGPVDWKVNGKTRKSWWLKTTEAGSYAGYIVVDAKTYMPIGHHYSELGAPGPLIEEYRVVELNPKLSMSDFQL